MPSIRIPLVLPASSRNYGLVVVGQNKDQLCTNCVFEITKNDATQQQSIYVRGRQEIATTGCPTDGSGDVTAIINWTGKGSSYAVYARGNTNSNIWVWSGTGSATDLGAITGQGVHISETEISGVPAIVVISNSSGGRTWFYVDGGALTEITDVDFPPKQTPALTITGNFVHLNGRAYIMTTNAQVWSSDINSLSGWTAATYLTASQRPDGGVGLARFKDIILGFGIASIEPFRDAGNQSASQLVRIENGVINVGLANEHALIEWEDTVAFIGRTGTTGLGVYAVAGIGAPPKKISDSFIDTFVESSSSGGVTVAHRLHVFQSDGAQYLAIDAGVAGGSGNEFIYHKEIPMWSYWTGPNAEIYKTATYGTFNLIATGGGIYKNQYNTKIDYQCRTGLFDMGTPNRKMIKKITPIGDAVSEAMTITLYNDDYTTGVAKTITSAVARQGANRWGMGRAFALKVATGSGTASPTQRRMLAMDIEYEVCAA